MPSTPPPERGMTYARVDAHEVRRRFPADAVPRLVLTDDSVAVAGPGGWAAAHPWLPGWEEWGISVKTADQDAEAAAALCAELERDGVSAGWYCAQRASGLLPFPPGWTTRPEPEGDDGCWDLMVATRVAAPTPGFAFVELDDAADADEIAAFNAAHNPRSEGHPGTGRTALWLGIRDGANLVAVSAWQPMASGTPYLAGLVVDETRRGRGLGGALLSELSRRALAAHDEICLGVDAENSGAIALYRRLGFVTAERYVSRDVTPPRVG